HTTCKRSCARWVWSAVAAGSTVSSAAWRRRAACTTRTPAPGPSWRPANSPPSDEAGPTGATTPAGPPLPRTQPNERRRGTHIMPKTCCRTSVGVLILSADRRELLMIEWGTATAGIDPVAGHARAAHDSYQDAARDEVSEGTGQI